MIRNVHSRAFPCPPAQLGELIDGLGSPSDALWPGGAWPRIRFDGPIAVGVAGRNGPIRYTVTEYVPGERLACRFDPSMFVAGGHTFSVLPGPVAGTAVLQHALVGQPRGVLGLLWPLAFRWLHDAFEEDMLDQAAVAVGSPPAVPARWSPYVRLLRARPRGSGASRASAGSRGSGDSRGSGRSLAGAPVGRRS